MKLFDKNLLHYNLLCFFKKYNLLLRLKIDLNNHSVDYIKRFTYYNSVKYLNTSVRRK